jgi:hypothetical protein
MGHAHQDPLMATSSKPLSEQPAPAPSGLRRILLKLSGEALMGQEDYGVDPKMLKRVALEIREVMSLGMQVAVVIGGGNIFRGAGLARAGMDRVMCCHPRGWDSSWACSISSSCCRRSSRRPRSAPW